jgi:GntR family transcriptional regulator/MocR family aminotransferase
VRCGAEQIVIVNGTQQAIDLVLRVLVDPGDRVAVEEPHYTGFSLALAAYGAEAHPVRVDSDGLCVHLLEEGPAVRGVFVTPSHQFPTGALLPLPRRLGLLAYAARAGAFVLEDDYDGELRYEGPPIECLQGLDEDGRVMYVGSASKLLFPSLRLAWLVATPELLPALRHAKALTDTGTSVVDQLTLADFISEGHLERHIRRLRARNAARREALARAMQRYLSGKATLAGIGAGLHGFVSIPSIPARREAEFRRKCAARGVGIYPVVAYYTTPPDSAAFLLGFSSLAEAAIDEGIRRVASVLNGFR